MNGAGNTEEVTLSPNNDPIDPRILVQSRELARTELTRVRQAAGNWRTGLAGLLALITTVSVVKGRDTIANLPLWDQIVIGVLLLLALICAAIGGYRAMRAAFGWPKEVGSRELPSWKYQQSKEAVNDLDWARNLTFATLILLVAAIGFTWYVPTDPPAFVNATRGEQGKVCGELVEGDGSNRDLTIEVDGVKEKVPLTELSALRIVEKC